MDRANDLPECWPALPHELWGGTGATLHLWAQIVGKVRLALAPRINHWWNVPLYVSARGLTTSPIPYKERIFEIHFDFIDHQLVVETSDGGVGKIALVPRSVAGFYREFMGLLRSMNIEVGIWRMPVEVPDPIAFDQDRVHASYDPEYAHRFWRILVSTDRVLKEFRSRFTGKCSPVHFFWGSFDLAVTRFSGRRAPPRQGADAVQAEAYSHEVSSAGFWPGGPTQPAAFYSYTVPEPPGFRDTRIRPEAGFFDQKLGEFILLYRDVRQSPSPTGVLLGFFQSTYEAGAIAGNWDREALER